MYLTKVGGADVAPAPPSSNGSDKMSVRSIFIKVEFSHTEFDTFSHQSESGKTCMVENPL